MERPRAFAHPKRPLDQGHALVAAQGARQAVDRPARAARRGPTGQQGALPRLPAQRRAQVALPARRPPTRAGAPRQLARLGVTVATGPVRQARAHDPPPPRRHPRRDPPRPLQRPPRGPQQPHPPDQPPQLRLPLSRTPDRPRLPLLQRHPHRPAAMNFTPKTTGAPQKRLLAIASDEALSHHGIVLTKPTGRHPTYATASPCREQREESGRPSGWLLGWTRTGKRDRRTAS